MKSNVRRKVKNNSKALINNDKTKFIFYHKHKNFTTIAGTHVMHVPNNRMPRVVALTNDDARIIALLPTSSDEIKIKFDPIKDKKFNNDSFLVNYISKETSIVDIYDPVKKVAGSALPINKQKKFGNDGLKVFYTPLDTGVCLAATDPAIKVLILPYTLNGGSIGQTDPAAMVTFNTTIRELWYEINLEIIIHQHMVKISLKDDIVQQLVKNVITTELKDELEQYEVKDIPVILRFHRFHENELKVQVTHIFKEELSIQL